MRAWTLAPAPMTEPARIRAFAAQSEADGWDGVMFPDNQSLWGDTYVSLTLAATVTTSLLLSNASTNAGTRHPAVTASAIAAVNQVSGGRASLGIARGDSALAHLGSLPVSVAAFDAYIGVVRALLRGKDVGFDQLERWRPASGLDALQLLHAPQASRLPWLPGNDAPVAIRAFASGPRTMAAGARHADQVIFGLGADLNRLRWGVDTVRTACEKYGRDPAAVKLGALMSIAVADDQAFARTLVANIVASSVRFSSLHGHASGPLSEQDRVVYDQLAAGYDMTAHGESGSQVNLLPEAFIDEFALVGPAGHCIDRLHRIRALGIDDVLLIVPRNDSAAAGVRSSQAVVDQVLPAIQAMR